VRGVSSIERLELVILLKANDLMLKSNFNGALIYEMNRYRKYHISSTVVVTGTSVGMARLSVP
jgi:hypothetical protein